MIFRQQQLRMSIAKYEKIVFDRHKIFTSPIRIMHECKVFNREQIKRYVYDNSRDYKITELQFRCDIELLEFITYLNFKYKNVYLRNKI